MTIGLRLELEWWKQFLPIIFLFLLLSQFLFGFAPFFGLTLLFIVVITTQFMEENKSEQLLFDMSLPITRDERVTARFVAYGLAIMSLMVVTFLFTIAMAYGLSYFTETFSVSITGPIFFAYVIWGSILFFITGTLLYFYTRFPMKTALWSLFALFIVLQIIFAIILFTNISTDSTPLASSSVTVIPSGTVDIELDVTSFIRNIAFALLPTSLLYYGICYFFAKRAFRRQQIGTKRSA